MKFTVIIASTLFFSSIMASPVAETSLFAGADATVPAAQAINGAMSGVAASASISINGYDASAQSAASERIRATSLILPIVIFSAIFLA